MLTMVNIGCFLVGAVLVSLILFSSSLFINTTNNHTVWLGRLRLWDGHP